MKVGEGQTSNLGDLSLAESSADMPIRKYRCATIQSEHQDDASV